MDASGGKGGGRFVHEQRRRIRVEYHPTGELKLDPQNPRDHRPWQIRQVARSLEAFGFIVPVVVDANLKVVAGEGRVRAALLLGLPEVPTISVDHLSEAQIKTFRIADNKLTENSSWNECLLSEELKFLANSELDFSVEVTGFSAAEIDMHIEGLAQELKDEDPADAMPETQTAPCITQPGDRWLLDDHVVLCGDARDEPSYRNLMRGTLAAMAFTDTPYNVAIKGHVSGLGAIQHRDFAMGCGEMSKQQFTAFLAQIFSLLARYSVKGALHFTCIDWRHLSEILAAGEQVYTELKNVCVWVKNHTGMGAFYRSRHELIFVYKNGWAAHRNNIMLGTHGRDRTNVWNYPSPRTPSEEGNLLQLHPTVKPTQLIADAILDCTARGDIVLDCCLGSGTSVIAASRTGRRCFGLEIDPKYVDTTVRRWQRYTGGQAVHTKSGRPFSELEAEVKEGDGK